MSAGFPVEMTFENQDAGIRHNFALYRDATAVERLLRSDYHGATNRDVYLQRASGEGAVLFPARCSSNDDDGVFVTT